MPRRARQAFKETAVRLSRATVTTFEGPGRDWLLVVSGERKGPPRVVRQSKGGRRHGS